MFSSDRYLIIHLKRFKSKHSFRHRKNTTKVDFPIVGLDLKQFLPLERMQTEGAIYDLFAISNHSGGLDGGHYYCYAKNPLNNFWYCFNDSSVRRLSLESLCISGAYMLFYERREEEKGKSFEIKKKGERK